MWIGRDADNGLILYRNKPEWSKASGEYNRSGALMRLPEDAFPSLPPKHKMQVTLAPADNSKLPEEK